MSLLLPDLEAFMAVIKFKSVQEASRNIGLTQTAVTQRIRSLEKKLGTTLFIRSRQGMSLTSEGTILEKYCDRFKGLEAELLHQVKGSNSGAQIRITISASSSLIKTRVIPSTSEIIQNYKNLAFSYNVVDDGTEFSYLKSGHSQFAIVPQNQVVNELDSKIIKPISYILVGQSAWKDRDLEDILLNEKLIDFYPKEDSTVEYLKKHNLINYLNTKGHFINNTDALISMLLKGLGYSVISETYVQKFIDDKTLCNLNKNKHYEQKLALVWYPRFEMPKYFKDIVSVIK